MDSDAVKGCGHVVTSPFRQNIGPAKTGPVGPLARPALIYYTVLEVTIVSLLGFPEPTCYNGRLVPNNLPTGKKAEIIMVTDRLN